MPWRNFPGSPVVKTVPFQCRAQVRPLMGGTKIPLAPEQEAEKKKPFESKVIHLSCSLLSSRLVYDLVQLTANKQLSYYERMQ